MDLEEIETENCINCGDELIFAFDEFAGVCAKCVAEEGHDWLAEPNAEFNRNGSMINKTKKDIEESVFNSLAARADRLGVRDIANVVLNDPRFPVWSGSGEPHHHHYGTGQLAIHTLEVVNLCFQNAVALGAKVDQKILYLGALFHDYGKCWDYRHNGYSEWNNWEKTPHCREIHHISRSAAEWVKAISKFNGEYKKYEDPVLHMILSHHGSREYGSPVFPLTREAWILHLCDGLSARINDCDKRDMLNNENRLDGDSAK